MTITATATSATIRTNTSGRPIWRGAALSGVLAAAATVSVAALADVAGISLEVDGEAIPVSGFATMTLMAVVVGYVLADRASTAGPRVRAGRSPSPPSR